jgi:hypothetical protein
VCHSGISIESLDLLGLLGNHTRSHVNAAISKNEGICLSSFNLNELGPYMSLRMNFGLIGMMMNILANNYLGLVLLVKISFFKNL